MSKKIIFDMDDILWGLNERVTLLNGVDMSKLVTFSTSDNPILTDEEKFKMKSCYGYDIIFQNIAWYDGIDLLKQLESEDVKVYINSNCGSEKIARYKAQQLRKKFDSTDITFILNLISDCKKKSIDEAFIFVDDSPHNLVDNKGKVQHLITINKPWNTSKYALEILGDVDDRLIRCNNLVEVMEKIGDLLNADEK